MKLHYYATMQCQHYATFTLLCHATVVYYEQYTNCTYRYNKQVKM
jgi:hypothetical protein